MFRKELTNLFYIKNNISAFSLCVKEKYDAGPSVIFYYFLRVDVSIPGVFGVLIVVNVTNRKVVFSSILV